MYRMSERETVAELPFAAHTHRGVRSGPCRVHVSASGAWTDQPARERRGVGRARENGFPHRLQRRRVLGEPPTRVERGGQGPSAVHVHPPVRRSDACALPPYSDEKERIVTVGISGGASLTRPLRDGRRFPSKGWYPVPRATRTTLGFGVRPSFKDHSLSRRAKP